MVSFARRARAGSSYLTTRRLWKCKGCKKQTSVKKGTVFEDSPLGLDKWLAALWLVVNCKNGINVYVSPCSQAPSRSTARSSTER